MKPLVAIFVIGIIVYLTIKGLILIGLVRHFKKIQATESSANAASVNAARKPPTT